MDCACFFDKMDYVVAIKKSLPTDNQIDNETIFSRAATWSRRKMYISEK